MGGGNIAILSFRKTNEPGASRRRIPRYWMIVTRIKQAGIMFIHMFTGWALCGAAIGIGRTFTSMENTLIIHAIAVPILFSAISFIYFRFFHYTRPFVTALIFMLFAMFMDAVVIAPFVEKNYAMFQSILGTWIPFFLIFISSFMTGKIVSRQ
jgi:hypothetical protein